MQPSPRRTLSLSALAQKFAPPESAPSPSRADPIEVLASMLDLRGSVRLAEILDRSFVASGSESAKPSAFAEVERRVSAILEQVPVAFESLRRPARMLRAIRAESEPRASARALADRYEEAMTRAIARARTDLRALRDELGEELRKASPRSLALHELDSALVMATRGAMTARFASVIPAAVRAFEERATERLVTAGQGVDLAKVEAWCRPEGWLGRAVGEGEATALAMARAESGLLLALAEAAAGL